MVEIIKTQLSLNCHSLKDLEDIAGKILDYSSDRKVIAIEGQLGAGKTTLIQYLCRKMGVRENITSPSFSIINEYADSAGKPVYHFDFYRIDQVEEVFNIGAEEYFYSGNICLIEWPSKAWDLIPNDHIFIEIEVSGPGSRIFQVKKV